nr:aldehyde dehydrogenase family protein [Gordonia sp. SL306]
MTFRTEDEAIALANDIPYGLTAGFWTTDLDRAHRLTPALRAGVIWINKWRLHTTAAVRRLQIQWCRA